MKLIKEERGTKLLFGSEIPKFVFILVSEEGEEKELSEEEFSFLCEAIEVYREVEEWGMEDDFTYTDIPPAFI